MNNKLLRISISYDGESPEPACVSLINTATGDMVEIFARMENVKSRVQAVLETWRNAGHGTLTVEVCEYYAAYAEYEVRRRAMDADSG